MAESDYVPTYATYQEYGQEYGHANSNLLACGRCGGVVARESTALHDRHHREDYRHVVLGEGEAVLLVTKDRLSMEEFERFNEVIPEHWRDRVLLVDGTLVEVDVLRAGEIASGLDGPIGDPPDPESDRL